MPIPTSQSEGGAEELQLRPGGTSAAAKTGAPSVSAPSASATRRTGEPVETIPGTEGSTALGAKPETRQLAEDTADRPPGFGANVVSEDGRCSQEDEAREQARARREHETSEYARRVSTAGVERTTEPRHDRDGGGLGRTTAPVRTRAASGTRMPTPGTLPAADGVLRMPKTRRKACGLDTCGWVTPTPGLECSVCPGQVVHSADDRLCVACHRPQDDKRFVHLFEFRVRRAAVLAAQWQESGLSLPSSLVRGFSPSKGCLCQRHDCFYTFLNDKEEQRRTRKCVECGFCNRSKGKGKFYRVPSGERTGTWDAGGNEGAWCCYKCKYGSARKRKPPSGQTA